MQESDIFRIARKLDGVAQADYLQQACGANAELRSDLEALLEVHRRQQGSTCHVSTAAQETQTLPMQTVFAERYQLREVLGQGGMGLVYLADQQEPIQRRVAIKIIKSSHASKAILTRFEQERQALALMDHPHIARIHDAGVTPLEAPGGLGKPVDTPYLVMEYLQGIPISKYCELHQLGVKERVALFIPVCQAIQHAHQKGIIHRDLKPSNILVVEQDGKPLAKVIDFGIAKAVELKLTAESIETEVGAIIGTLEYMSPEQARLKNQDIDTRTDIYSLGVILYELISGLPPFSKEEFSQCDLSQALAMIQEKEPAKPSSRLSESGSGITTQSRLTNGRKSKQLVQGDLDWIVMKCLEKDRNRRYDSAGQLGQDLERYLANEAVLAGPPNWQYKLRKLMARHRGKMMAASLVFVALAAGIIATTLGWQRALAAETLAENKAHEAKEALQREQIQLREVEKQRDLVQDEKKVAQAVTHFLQNKLLGQGDFRVQYETLLRQYGVAQLAEHDPRISQLLRRAEDELAPEKIEKNFPKQPLVQAALLRTVGETYMNVGVLERTPAILQRALALYAAQLGEDNQLTLVTKNSLGVAQLNLGNYDQGKKTLQEVHEAKRRVLGPLHPDTLIAANNLAHAWTHSTDYATAKQLHMETIQQRTQRLGPDHADTLFSQSSLGFLLARMGQTTEAIQLLEATHNLQSQRFGKDHPDTLVSQHRLADAYSNAGRYREAATLLEYVYQERRRELGDQHPRTLGAGESLGAAYCVLGRLSESRTLLETIRQQYLASMPEDHPDVLSAGNYLAMTLREQKQYPEALALFKDVEGKLAKRYGNDFYHLDTVRNNIASTYYTMKRYPEAIELFLQVVANREKTMGRNHPGTMRALSNLGAAYTQNGESAKALPILQEVVEFRVRELGATHLQTLNSQSSLSLCYFRLKQYDRALPLMELVYDERLRQLGDTHQETIKALNQLGKMNWTDERFDKSVRCFEKLHAVYGKLKNADPGEALMAQTDLGVNYKDSKRYQEAIPLLTAAFAKVEKHPDIYYAGPALIECHLNLKDDAKAQAVIEQVLAYHKSRHANDPVKHKAALQTFSKRLEKHKAPLVKDLIGRELAAIK